MTTHQQAWLGIDPDSEVDEAWHRAERLYRSLTKRSQEEGGGSQHLMRPQDQLVYDSWLPPFAGVRQDVTAGSELPMLKPSDKGADSFSWVVDGRLAVWHTPAFQAAQCYDYPSCYFMGQCRLKRNWLQLMKVVRVADELMASWEHLKHLSSAVFTPVIPCQMPREALYERFSFEREWKALKWHRNAVLQMAGMEEHALNFHVPMRMVVHMDEWGLTKEDITAKCIKDVHFVSKWAWENVVEPGVERFLDNPDLGRDGVDRESDWQYHPELVDAQVKDAPSDSVFVTGGQCRPKTGNYTLDQWMAFKHRDGPLRALASP